MIIIILRQNETLETIARYDELAVLGKLLIAHGDQMIIGVKSPIDIGALQEICRDYEFKNGEPLIFTSHGEAGLLSSEPDESTKKIGSSIPAISMPGKPGLDLLVKVIMRSSLKARNISRVYLPICNTTSIGRLGQLLNVSIQDGIVRGLEKAKYYGIPVIAYDESRIIINLFETDYITAQKTNRKVKRSNRNASLTDVNTLKEKLKTFYHEHTKVTELTDRTDMSINEKATGVFRALEALSKNDKFKAINEKIEKTSKKLFIKCPATEITVISSTRPNQSICFAILDETFHAYLRANKTLRKAEEDEIIDWEWEIRITSVSVAAEKVFNAYDKYIDKGYKEKDYDKFIGAYKEYFLKFQELYVQYPLINLPENISIILSEASEPSLLIETLQANDAATFIPEEKPEVTDTHEHDEIKSSSIVPKKKN